MTTEAPRPNGEQQPVDPVQVARGAFNKTLLGGEYNGAAVLGRTIQLQNALLGSNLTPERVYHELSIVSGQAADRAELNQDVDTASTLRELQKGFELTYETFRPRREAELARSIQPTQTETLPPMTSAKGEQATATSPTRTRRQNVQPEAEAVAPAAAPEPTKPEQKAEGKQQATTTSEAAIPTEESFTDLLRQLRTERKLSQKALGDKIGLTNVNVSLLERGFGSKKNTTPEMADKLVEALGLDEAEASHLRELFEKQYGAEKETN